MNAETRGGTRTRSGIVVAAGVCSVCVAALLLILSQPERTQALPPRPTPGSTATPTPTPQPASPVPRGPYIELIVSPARPDLWTVVEWGDGKGGWYTVTGWAGTLDDEQGTRKRWWVASRDLGSGPFRWLVYDRPGGALLGTSQPFFLPAAPDDVVWVEVTLP